MVKVKEKYEYQVAISLLKEDIELGRKIHKLLNPKLNVFFYESNQKDLITKNGIEEFANIFKLKSRVVVILYREKWSNTTYTNIEKNAVFDRIKNESDSFIFLIPLDISEKGLLGTQKLKFTLISLNIQLKK